MNLKIILKFDPHNIGFFDVYCFEFKFPIISLCNLLPCNKSMVTKARGSDQNKRVKLKVPQLDKPGNS